MVSLQNHALEKFSLPELDFSPIQIESTTAKFDLTLDMRETHRGLVGRWEYRTDLFKAETIHRLAGHFRNIAQSIAHA